MKEWTLQRINNLIEEGVEESQTLEYKASGALSKEPKKRKEIAKDVSAMANAQGGTIIYGISENKENKYLPGEISPINRTEYSKEWLEDVIDGNISPKIDGIIIRPIELNEANQVLYIVQIPQSETAHQNTLEYKYYKRSNFKASPMLDYEVRDIMNRSKNPQITVELGIEDANFDYEDPQLEVFLKNKGAVYAKYINFELYIYESLLPGQFDYFYAQKNEHGAMVVKFSGSNKVNSNFEPLLPRTSKRKFHSVQLRKNFYKLLKSDIEIKWITYADNAPPLAGQIKLKDIPVYNKP